jgi:hypothetical protein
MEFLVDYFVFEARDFFGQIAYTLPLKFTSEPPNT